MTPGSDKKLIVPPQPGKEQNSGKSRRGNVLNRSCVGRWGVGSQVCLQIPVSLLWSFTKPSPQNRDEYNGSAERNLVGKLGKHLTRGKNTEKAKG